MIIGFLKKIKNKAFFDIYYQTKLVSFEKIVYIQVAENVTLNEMLKSGNNELIIGLSNKNYEIKAIDMDIFYQITSISYYGK